MLTILSLRRRPRAQRDLLIALVVAGVGIVAIPAHGATIFEFGGDYVSSNSTLARALTDTAEGNTGGDWNGDSDTTDNIFAYGFSTSTVLSPATGYSGPTFYGGFYSHRNATSNQNVSARIQNDGTADFLRFAAGASDGLSSNSGTGSLHTVTVFLKDEFINGGESDPVTFNNDSSMTATVVIGGSASSNASRLGRFVVRDGTDYYISQDAVTLTVTAGTTGDATFSIANLGTALFAPYNLLTGLENAISIDFSGGSFTVAGSSFTDVNAVGIFLENSSAQGTVLGLRTLTVEANTAVIPEPTSLALLGLGSVALLRRRRALS